MKLTKENIKGGYLYLLVDGLLVSATPAKRGYQKIRETKDCASWSVTRAKELFPLAKKVEVLETSKEKGEIKFAIIEKWEK